MNSDRIITGDSFEELDTLPENSVHACVTDPPYGLAFMGRDWDDFEPKEYQEWCEDWAREVKRVLKPGGHLLAFSGNRTHHRLFTGIEDAGFEIRDCITWHYGSGFPKASDVSKTIDKRASAERAVIGENPHLSPGDPDRTADTETSQSGATIKAPVTEPATEEAKKWDGWKTGLKPATEFVVMARKPFDGATVDCVQEHGTGALNIDATRIETDRRPKRKSYSKESVNDYGDGLNGSVATGETTEGRYPANVVFDETEAERLDEDVGEIPAGSYPGKDYSIDDKNLYGDNRTGGNDHGELDSGGPSRYFYTSKASKAERTEDGSIDNSHPTVKPQDLMEWLVKLVTREDQIVLDPFAGSGTTCKAAKELNRRFIGIEKQAKWADVARVRCNLTPENPAVVRDDENQQGLEGYTD